MHFPSADRTIWHITFGTYGTRLHGGVRPTVDRRHNDVGQPFLDVVPQYEQVERKLMQQPPRLLSSDERCVLNAAIPNLCERGGWTIHAWVVQADHVHLLLEADRGADGKTIRTLLKRWTTQVLKDRFSQV